MDLAQPPHTAHTAFSGNTMQWCIGKANLFGYTEDKLSQL